MLKYLLDTTEINILNIERYRVHSEWRHNKVSSPYSRIYLITEGDGYIYYHKLKRRINLTPGHMYLIPCYTLVDLYCPKTFVHYYIHFTSRTHLGADLLGMVKCDYCINAKTHQIDRRIFDDLTKLNPFRQLMERDANKPIYADIVKRAMDADKATDASALLKSNALMRLLISQFISSDQTPAVDNTIKGLDRFEAVIQVIQDNIANKFSLSQLAQIANLHPTYFSNLFTKLMGLSPAKYVNRVRIEKAQSLLLSSTSSLKSIADQTGFDDVFYFSRVFRNCVGISPAKYRKQAIHA